MKSLLTFAAKHALIEAIEKQDGLTANVFFDGLFPCAMGALGMRSWSWGIGNDELTRLISLGLATSNYRQYTEAGELIVITNNDFIGTPQKRKEYMLKWLHEQEVEVEIVH